MDSNSELMLRALRYFNDNRSEKKTAEDYAKEINVKAHPNLLHDLEISEWISPADGFFKITVKGETKINELQTFKNSENNKIGLISAATIIGIVQIFVACIQVRSSNQQTDQMIEANEIAKQGLIIEKTPLTGTCQCCGCCYTTK